MEAWAFSAVAKAALVHCIHAYSICPSQGVSQGQGISSCACLTVQAQKGTVSFCSYLACALLVLWSCNKVSWWKVAHEDTTIARMHGTV